MPIGISAKRFWQTLTAPGQELVIRRRKCAALGVFFFVSVFVAYGWMHTRYDFFYESKQEGCLPWSLYLASKSRPEAIPLGSIVIFKATKMEPVIKNGTLIGKLVVGVAGDRIVVKAGQLYVNEQSFGNLVLGSRKLGRPMTFWDRTYTLSPGELFVFGTEPRSWDSRYWGILKNEEVLALAQPIL
jgi:conjugal transfer pilin signal peptidase TrbI